MAEKVADLSIVIRAKNAAKAVLGQVQTGFQKLKDVVFSVRGALATIGAGLIFRDIVNTIAGFEQAMSGVRAVTKATAEEMEALKKEARDLGAKTAFSAQEAAQGMEFLGRAGFDTGKILQSTEATLNLAAAGSLELARAADISSNVLSGFRLEADEMNRVVDVMAATAAKANTDIEQLGEGMKLAAPIAAEFKVEVEETSAAIGVLSNAGLQGSLAGTGLRRVIKELAAPTKELKVFLGDASLATNTFSELLEILSKSAITGSEAFEIFGDRGAPAFSILKAGVADLNRLNEALLKAGGTAKEMARTKLDNLKGLFEELSGAIEEVFLIAGDSGLTGVLKKATKALTEFFRGIAEKQALDAAKNANTLAAAYARVNEEIQEIDKFLNQFGDTSKATSGSLIAQAIQQRENLLLVKDAFDEISKAEGKTFDNTERLLADFEKINAAISDPKIVKNVVEVEKEIGRIAELIVRAQKEMDAALAIGDTPSANIKFNVIEQAKQRLLEFKKILLELTTPNLDLQGLPNVAAQAWRQYSQALNEVTAAQLKVLEGEQALAAQDFAAAQKKLDGIRKVLDVENELKEFQRERLKDVFGQEVFNSQTLQAVNEKLRDADQVQGQERIRLLREAANEAKKLTKDFESGSLLQRSAVQTVEEALRSLSEEIKNQEKLDPAQSVKQQFQEAANNLNKFAEKFKALQEQVKDVQAVVRIVDQDKLIADAEKLKNELLTRFSTPIEQTIIVKQKAGEGDAFAGFTNGPGGSAPSDSGVAVPGAGLPKSSIPIRSFATGIRLVPRDMIARLHEDERVLTARENRELGSGRLGGSTISFGDIVVQVGSSTEAPEVTARRIHEELKRIDERKSV